MTQYSGKLYPNGEFGISAQKRFTPEAIQHRRSPTETQRWWMGAVKQFGILKAMAVRKDCDRATEVAGSTLGLSRVAKTHKSLRGVKGITNHGRRCIRNAAFLMEERYGKANLSFWTLTLPTLSPEDWRTVLEKWSEVLRYLFIYLRRLLQGAGLPDFIMYVVELQPKRTERDGVPALHLHGLFLGRLPGERQWKIKPTDLREIWRRSLNSVCGLSLSSWQMRSTENIQQVKLNAGAYLAKYMSKGSGVTDSLLASWNLARLVPSWWGLSSSMRRWLKGTVISISPEVSYVFLKVIESPSDTRSKVNEVFIPTDEGGKRGIGYYGRLFGSDLTDGQLAASGKYQLRLDMYATLR